MHILSVQQLSYLLVHIIPFLSSFPVWSKDLKSKSRQLEKCVYIFKRVIGAWLFDDLTLSLLLFSDQTLRRDRARATKTYDEMDSP